MILKKFNSTLELLIQEKAPMDVSFKKLGSLYIESIDIVKRIDNQNIYKEYFAMHDLVIKFFRKNSKNISADVDKVFKEFERELIVIHKKMKMIYFEKSMHMSWLATRFNV